MKGNSVRRPEARHQATWSSAESPQFDNVDGEDVPCSRCHNGSHHPPLKKLKIRDVYVVRMRAEERAGRIRTGGFERPARRRRFCDPERSEESGEGENTFDKDIQLDG